MIEGGVGIVGGGRISRILLAGWRRASQPLPPITVSDIDERVRERLQAEFPGITVTSENRAAAKLNTVLLALHPPAIPAVLGEIKESIPADGVLVSLAPRWTMSRIGEMLGGFARLARVIPNAPSIVNRGYNPISFSNQLAPADRDYLRSLFASLGACPEVEEKMLEAYAIVAAMGPTYLWYQLYELIDLGCAFGLTTEAATSAVAAMVNGAVDTVVEPGMTAAQVIDLIPVKPLAGIEQTVKEAYRSTLEGLYRKLAGPA